jgi:hypothetical protein
MSLNMSMEATKEYVELKAKRYRLLRGKKAKGQILNEVVETTGYGRKHVIRLLGSYISRKHKHGRRPGRPRKLTSEDIFIIKEIWKTSEQPCGKRLKVVLEVWLPYWIKERGPLPEEQLQRILSTGAATLDRVLSSIKVKRKKPWGPPKGLRAIQAEIPIRQGAWTATECGWIEGDTVAHCGSSMKGSFVWTLTLTDIMSQWTELGATWNKGQESVVRSLELILKRFPFPLKGIDTDNGSEFLNAHLQRFWKDHPDRPQITRSRPYHKNDNAHVEQKNRTLVRELIGYDRLDKPQCVELLEDVYEIWCLQNNHFIPRMKLHKRYRVASRIVKEYTAPETPYQRVMESPLRAAAKRKLQSIHQSLNPLRLQRQYEEKLKRLYNWIANENHVQHAL